MTYSYRVYGLTLHVPFPCPVLTDAPADVLPDVTVIEGSVPFTLESPLAKGDNWQLASGRFLFQANRRVGRFLVENGTRVTVERNPSADDDMLAVPMMGIVLATILIQRGHLVLHANTAITPTGAVVVSGESGTGKSTTLAALLDRGCAMLSDDITVLSYGAEGQVQALPGISHLHLCEDAARTLGHDIEGLPRYPWRRMKAAVPSHEFMATAPAPLRAIYLLHMYSGDTLRISTLKGHEKFSALQECLFGPLLLQEHAGLFALLASVAEQVSMFRIERPASGWSVHKVVEAILHG